MVSPGGGCTCPHLHQRQVFSCIAIPNLKFAWATDRLYGLSAVGKLPSLACAMNNCLDTACSVTLNGGDAGAFYHPAQSPRAVVILDMPRGTVLEHPALASRSPHVVQNMVVARTFPSTPCLHAKELHTTRGANHPQHRLHHLFRPFGGLAMARTGQLGMPWQSPATLWGQSVVQPLGPNATVVTNKWQRIGPQSRHIHF